MPKKKPGKSGYTISVVAGRFGIHPQTLRLYEREGLLKPSRTDGNTRLYTDDDMQRLEVVLSLTRDLGVNLAGVEIILNMREKMEEMGRQMHEFASYVTEQMGSLPREAPPSFSTSLIPLKRTSINRSRTTPRKKEKTAR